MAARKRAAFYGVLRCSTPARLPYTPASVADERFVADIPLMANPAIDLEALRRLPVEQRLQLVEDLWDTIAQDAPDEAFPMTPELAAELDRRIAEADANPDAGIPWEQVRANIRGRRKP